MERTHALGAIWQRLSLANLAGLLSLGSAAVHIIVMPEHFREWWGYGAFFAALASLQAIYGLGLLQPKARLSLSPWYLLAGILGTFLVMVLYGVTRSLGIPAFGPHAGHVEGLDALGLLSNGLELGLVATLSGMVLRLPSLGRRFWTRAGVIAAGILLMAGALVLASIATNESDEPSPSTSETSPATYVQDLTRALTRTEPAARYGGLVDL
ncbi:MAG: hypothetical protein HY532_03145, partial [Chloroflexi bacterium]|nr:hypothetical protein [Chloroflexota bacterium]